jgi:hypothetical protein
MMPPPPGRFSTMALSFQRAWKPAASSRASTSLEPPGVNGTMMWISLLGKSCAWAGAPSTAAAATAHKASNRLMWFLPAGTDSLAMRRLEHREISAASCLPLGSEGVIVTAQMSTLVGG